MKKLILLISIVATVLGSSRIVYAQPGYINTIAGNGTSGYSGDGGPALSAEMKQALGGIVVDNSGNVYFPDDDNYRIRKISSTGIITTVAGGGTSTADGIPATDANLSLNAAGTIAMDATGNIYFSDGNRIRKITMSTGILTTIVGTGTGGYNGDGGPATAAELNYPVGICFDASGNLYIGDETNRRIRIVNTSGIINTFAGTGTAGFSGDGGPATAAELQSPDGVVADAAGNLYVADRYNYRIRKINTAGIITTYAGSGTDEFCGDGGPATAACFYEPSNLRIDSYGNLYIADFHNGRVRIVNPSGIVNTFAGGGSSISSGIPATSASLTDVWNIGMDSYNNIYISDRTNYRICRVGPGFPTVTADSFSVVVSNSCSGLNFEVVTNSYSAGQHVTTYFGDGSSVDTMATEFGTHGVCSFFESYYTGAYSIKHVLYDGTTPVDSVSYTQSFVECQNFTVKFYLDANGNCIKDSSEIYLVQPVLTEVDSNGVAVDIISAMSGFYYTAYGTTGDVYQFKVLSTLPGMAASCPVSGIISDTLGTSVSGTKYIAFQCTTGSSFDIAVNDIISVTGVYDQCGNLYATNTFCEPVDATVTLHYSQKYGYSGTGHATPNATSYTDSTITWNIPGLSPYTPFHVYYGVNDITSSGPLIIGDTVGNSMFISPTAGDVDTLNNYCIVLDTVKGGCDPNEMEVSPSGYISAGTQLQYTIQFENTGNDTAFNIYIMDTLSPNVNINTMQMQFASTVMYISNLKDLAGDNIVKFDFPNIDLLDSSYHNLCNGAVIFNINTLPGLSPGTTIFNHAGIFFDFNPVVMTDTVEDIIGSPTKIKNVKGTPKISIFPNPAATQLSIIMSPSAYTSFTITNSIGQDMIQQPLSATKTVVNVATLPPGLYYITFRGDNGTTVQKFVKL